MAITKKSEVVELMAQKSGLTKKDSELAYNALVDAVAEQLEGLEIGKVVTLPKLCKFSAVERQERQGVNPQNPEQKITIPACKALKVTTFKSLKDIVKEVL